MKKVVWLIGLVLMATLVLLESSTISAKEKKLTKSLIITSSPSPIEVYVNNKPYFTPVRVMTTLDKVTVFGSKDKYEIYQKIVWLKTNKTVKLHIKLVKQTVSFPLEGAPMREITEPKIKNLPYENEHFRITWNSQTLSYLVVPNIPFTNQDAPQTQLKKYWSSYTKYSQEALLWLQKQKIDLKKAKIEWWAEEWWPENAKPPSIK